MKANRTVLTIVGIIVLAVIGWGVYMMNEVVVAEERIELSDKNIIKKDNHQYIQIEKKDYELTDSLAKNIDPTTEREYIVSYRYNKLFKNSGEMTSIRKYGLQN